MAVAYVCALSPDPSPGREGDTPYPHLTLLGAFNAAPPKTKILPILYHRAILDLI